MTRPFSSFPPSPRHRSQEENGFGREEVSLVSYSVAMTQARGRGGSSQVRSDPSR
jgi:hypothetical protein